MKKILALLPVVALLGALFVHANEQKMAEPEHKAKEEAEQKKAKEAEQKKIKEAKEAEHKKTKKNKK